MRSTLLVIGCLAWVGCSPPEGSDPCVLGETPESIDALVELTASLPEPTVTCFLKSLARPLEVAASVSTTSTQTSTLEDPRTFLFLGPDLVVSTVARGPAAGQLEISERFDGTRTIKAELFEPFGNDAYEHIREGEGTKCGVCHRDELPTGDGRFASRALQPHPDQRVSVGDGALDHLACEDLEGRCERLDALFGYGRVEAVDFGVGFDQAF